MTTSPPILSSAVRVWRGRDISRCMLWRGRALWTRTHTSRSTLCANGKECYLHKCNITCRVCACVQFVALIDLSTHENSNYLYLYIAPIDVSIVFRKGLTSLPVSLSDMLPSAGRHSTQHTSPKHNAYPTWTKQFDFEGVCVCVLIHNVQGVIQGYPPGSICPPPYIS